MLSSRKSRIATGVSLVTIALVGLAFAAGRAVILKTHRHVVVSIFNVDSITQLFVNCHQAATVGRRKPGATVDLGWLQPDDRVFLSATSRDGNPAWGFRASSNGTAFFKGTRGDAEVPGFAAEPNAVVFAKAFTAGGDYLGQIGCQPPGVVAVPGYARSPDDAEVSEVTGAAPSYRPPSAPYDQIDAVGRWSLTALAVLGAIAALGTQSIRKLAWSHKAALASGALGLVGAIAAFPGIAALLTTLTIAGILLLFAASILLLLPAGEASLESAAGAGGAEGEEEDHAAADRHDPHLAADDGQG